MKPLSPRSLLPLMLSLMMVSIPAVDAFVAYNCANGSNPVIPYSLLEPEPCALTGVDLKFERTLNGEIIQMRRERIITVQRCTVMESTFSQYCGHSSAAGVTRYLKFREPRLVEAQHCRQAFAQGGKIKINNEDFKAVIGTTTSHSTYAAGDLDDAGHCSTGTLTAGGKKIGYQTASYVYEVTLIEETARVNDLTGMIRLSDRLVAKYADRSVQDSMFGTFVWVTTPASCPDTLVSLYRGPIRVFQNITASASLTGGLAVLERQDQVAGLELGASLFLCKQAAYRTHLRDVVIAFHLDNTTSIAQPFDPSIVSEMVKVESELSFYAIKNGMSQKEVVRSIRAAVCENRRQILWTRLEAVAGTDNQYSLLQLFGPGHQVSRAGATVYVTKCYPVSVTPRTPKNCTHEIPVEFNGTDYFVDPVSLVLRPTGVIIKCNSIAPPRYSISGKFYCAFPEGLRECHAPNTLPLTPLEIKEDDEEVIGLGRSIYSHAQMEEFVAFQTAQGARAAYVAEQTEIAFQRRGPGGEWGLGLNAHATSEIIDLIGHSFIPLYRIFGPLSVIIILSLFVLGSVRVLVTIIIRIIILTRAEGCGLWILTAFWGTLFQLAMSPLRWVDRISRDIARRVEEQMMSEAHHGAQYPADQIRQMVAIESRKPLWQRLVEARVAREAVTVSREPQYATVRKNPDAPASAASAAASAPLLDTNI